MTLWRRALKDRGGRVLQVALEAGDLAALERVHVAMAQPGASDSDAVSWALQVAARWPARPSPKLTRP